MTEFHNQPGPRRFRPFLAAAASLAALAGLESPWRNSLAESKGAPRASDPQDRWGVRPLSRPHRTRIQRPQGAKQRRKKLRKLQRRARRVQRLCRN
ncbi:MAG TPA: hypothetical protein VFM97_00185 [Gammaproteobacteria bacterium]|nr:hypothetical protein [Gammaproteobacteria bacterium]